MKKKTMSSPGQTHVRPVHLGEAWHQNPARETSCRCRSPGWSRRQPAVPWHSHLVGKGSCNGVRWAGMGCLGPEWFNKIKHTSASHCNYACSPLGCESYWNKKEESGWKGLNCRQTFLQGTAALEEETISVAASHLSGSYKFPKYYRIDRQHETYCSHFKLIRYWADPSELYSNLHKLMK